jgi:hypothetical protein
MIHKLVTLASSRIIVEITFLVERAGLTAGSGRLVLGIKIPSGRVAFSCGRIAAGEFAPVLFHYNRVLEAASVTSRGGRQNL